MTTARRVLLTAWGGYALLWLTFVAIAIPYWPWRPQEVDIGFAMRVILGFGLGLLVTLLALAIGVVLGWRALRQPPHRTWANLILVGASIFGVAAHAFWFFASMFVFGVR